MFREGVKKGIEEARQKGIPYKVLFGAVDEKENMLQHDWPQMETKQERELYSKQKREFIQTVQLCLQAGYDKLHWAIYDPPILKQKYKKMSK